MLDELCIQVLPWSPDVEPLPQSTLASPNGGTRPKPAVGLAHSTNDPFGYACGGQLALPSPVSNERQSMLRASSFVKFFLSS